MPIEIPAALAEARTRIAEVAEKRRQVIAGPADRGVPARIREFDADLAKIVGELRDRLDPCDASAETPLVLLPVRVETKLVAGTSTLRVRITPDEVHVDSLARRLADAEAAAGRAYWSTLWADAASATAWPDLVKTVGDRRAGWVAYATTPVNLAERGNGDPAFPELPEEITRGTVARCLPDQFVVRVYPVGAEPVTVVGAPVAPDVPISPVSFSDDEVVQASNLTVPAGSEWTVDFEQAKKVGLGVEVTLPAGTTVIDRVVVVGARRSLDEEESAKQLTELLASHRFTDGVSLLANGTPTNNADAERSPYRPGWAIGAPPVTPPAPSPDALGLAAALGLDPVAVETLTTDASATPSSLGAAEAAANTALWFASWEPALQRIDANIPGITPATIESARLLHRDHVRGAGPAPALRVGAQPYGILPVTDLGSWKPRSGETTEVLAALVARTLPRYTARSSVVPQVRPGDQVTDEQLLDLLGTSPVSTGVRARPAVDGERGEILRAAVGGDPAQLEAETVLGRAVLSQFTNFGAQMVLTPALHEDSRRIALPFVSERDAEVVAEILAGRSAKVDSVLQALLDVAWDEVQRVRYRAAPKEYVQPLIDLVTIDPSIRELVLLAASDQPVVDQVAPSAFFDASAKVQAERYFDTQPEGAISLSAIEPVAEARTSLAQVALDLGDSVEAKWVGASAISGVLHALGIISEVRTAMTELAAAPLEERRIAVAHAIDVASHRVDAWATGLADSRRHELATTNPTGLTVGAFGYVEKIRLDAARSPRDGWLHAPSTAHAVAAGVLSSAHDSNVGAKDGAHPFAIDLSSRRGATLRRVLEGVHAGQSVGAIVGYQIERALTGSAARFQLSLREIAPLETDELNNDLAEADRTSRIAAADVVDGVELLRQFPVSGLRVDNPPLRQRLGTQPANAYVTSWEPVQQPEWDTVVAALEEAAATIDAVADALLSESVLQYASGNASRASAAMDAMSSGAAVDPDLGVLGVRQSGRILTHSLFAAIPKDAAGWSTTRPRAIAEPRLEAWAARRLGDPANVIVTDSGGERHSLAEAGFAALDLVFADDIVSLGSELRAAIPALGETPLAEARGADWPAEAQPIVAIASLAGTLRSLAAGAAVLEPDSLVRTGVDPQHRIDTDELLDRTDALVGRLRAVLDAGRPAIDLIDQVTLSVAEDQVAAVVGAVSDLASFGVPLVPDPSIPSNVAWAWGAWVAASARLEQATETLAMLRAPRLSPLTAGEIIDACTAVAEGLLGDGFRLLPLLVRVDGAATDDFFEAATSPLFPQPSRSRLSAFIRDLATVKPGVARLAEAQLLGGAIARPTPLTVVQLAERTGGSPAPGTDRWLAGTLPDDVPWPETPVTHAVVELVGAPDALNGPIAGFLFDGWAETLPFQPGVRAFDPAAPANPLRASRATTALAVKANQASARAPQVVLSAVSPDGARWTTDSVVRTVLSAIDLAKARTVTLENSPDGSIFPALYVASPWLQARKGFQFEELSKVAWAGSIVPYLSEMK